MENQPDNSDKGKWYVVNTLSGHENKVKESIENQLLLENDPELAIYEVMIPTEKISEVRQGKRVTSTRKFFPGYILVRMDLYRPDQTINVKSWFSLFRRTVLL